MELRAEEISRILRDQIADFDQAVEVSETGSVLSVGDGVARVYGLDKVMAGELGISGLHQFNGRAPGCVRRTLALFVGLPSIHQTDVSPGEVP